MKITVTDVSSSIHKLVTDGSTEAIADAFARKTNGRTWTSFVVLRNGPTNSIFITQSDAVASDATSVEIKKDEAFSFETSSLYDVKLVCASWLTSEVRLDVFS